MAENEEVHQKTLNNYLHPTCTATPSCIMFPPNMPNLDFKPGMIQLLPTFHSLESENPYIHIREFEEVMATFHNRANAVDSVRLKFFPFSLKDKAKSWLYSLRSTSIGTWEEMTTKFFNSISHTIRPMVWNDKFWPLLKKAMKRFIKSEKGLRIC